MTPLICYWDGETFYDDVYSIKKMTPAEYVLDPRFQLHGFAYQIDTPEKVGEPQWMAGRDAEGFFNWLKYKRACGHSVTMVCFNSLFDQTIVAWRYNFVPDLMVDVLGMVRALYGPAMKRHSLEATAEYLQLPVRKRPAILAAVKGMRTEELEAAPVYKDFVSYSHDDIVMTRGAFHHMKPSFPVSEYKVMDLVIRCAVQPQFVYDIPLLEAHLTDVKERKAELLAACGMYYDADGRVPELMSATKFAKILEDHGVMVEMKTTLTGRQAPAIAKIDKFMQDLLEHEDETIAALAAARLGHKSTLEETRTQRFISIATLPDAPGFKSGLAPIPLRYGAAHTHRLGGDWQLNKQNLPRGGKLRKSIKAPPGYTVVTADEAQIEARLSAWLARERTLLREFSEKLDPYAQLGSAIFGIPVNKKYNPVERFIGKTGILGLGYGAGAAKFHIMVNSMARTNIPKELLATFSFTEEMAEKAVKTYRERYPRMKYTWNVLGHDGIRCLTQDGPAFIFPPLTIRRGYIEAPNGQRMIYPDLNYDATIGPNGEIGVFDGWSYQQGNQRARIYGPKLLENITQWLARNIVMDAATRLDALGLRFALQAHDELAFVIRNEEVAYWKPIIKQEMERRPSWAPDLPLEVDMGQGANYGESK